MSNAWDSYLHYMLLKKQVSPTEYIDNANEHAFLSDRKGNVLSLSPNFKFLTYDVELTGPDGKATMVHFIENQEFFNALSTNFEKAGPYGIRLNNEKYMLSKFDKDKATAYFSKKDGGATCALTTTMVVFASYNTKIEGGDKVKQNMGQCNKAVEQFANYLKSNKY